MTNRVRFRGKDYGEEEAAFIRELIAENPGATRRALSLKLCEAWNWVQANGALRDQVCRKLLLALERAGLIQLPAPLYSRPVPEPRRSRAGLLSETEFTRLETGLSELRPVAIEEVRRTEAEGLFEALIEKHHYLGYTQPVGEHLKYLVRARGEPVACFVWASAPRHIGCRDRHIGWSKEARRHNIHLIAYNQRLLIVPWVKVPHLATHILGRVARRLSRDWQEAYNHPLYFLETFVDPGRFRGTCYLAANWVELGETTGRGKDDVRNEGPNRSIKKVLGYALTRDFREKLCAR